MDSAAATAAAAATLAKSEGTIGSRFVSQDAVDEAKVRQAEEWKAAYARIGQEPPPAEPEEAYDGRTLFERLNSIKEAKREEWDDKMKLSNQYRGLENEELQFLAEKARERKAAERLVEQAENDEVREYREALAAKHAAATAAAAPRPLASSSKPLPKPSTTASTNKIPVKKKPNVLQNLKKGLIIKKAKPAASSSTPLDKEAEKVGPIPSAATKDGVKTGNVSNGEKESAKRPADDEVAEDGKRRKVES